MSRPTFSRMAKTALAAFAVTVTAMGGLHLHAQSIAGFNSNAPVNFDAGTIDFDDGANRVVLSGNVLVTQADLRLRSERMTVAYRDIGRLQVQRIDATGGVQVNRGNESARGNVAVYDFDRRLITLVGNVSLRKGSDVLNGGRLVMDLRSGISSIDGSPNGGAAAQPGDGSGRPRAGRVTGSFVVPQD